MIVPDRLLLNRSDPEWRALAEAEGAPRTRMCLLVCLGSNNYNNYNYNNYDYNNYDYNYNNYNNYNYNYNNNSYNNSYSYNNREPNMREGLKAVCIPFGYSVAWLVGTLERGNGDEYTLVGKRILSIGSKTHEAVLADTTNELSQKTTYELHRLQILASVELDKKWEPLLK